MSRPDFERCTVEATKLLYRQNISNRILNIQNLTYDKNIVFDSIQNYCQLTHSSLSNFLSEDKQMLHDGCTIYYSECDCYIILYNADIQYFEHLNWTLAHEIGHIYLGHIKDDDIEEIEAHYFASQMFMPDYTLFMAAHEYIKITAYDITEIFGVSEEAANKRICTMKKRTLFNASQKAREIWSVQKERIDIYYECKREGWDFRNTLAFCLKMKADYEKERRLEAYVDAQYR